VAPIEDGLLKGLLLHHHRRRLGCDRLHHRTLSHHRLHHGRLHYCPLSHHRLHHRPLGHWLRDGRTHGRRIGHHECEHVARLLVGGDLHHHGALRRHHLHLPARRRAVGHLDLHFPHGVLTGAR